MALLFADGFEDGSQAWTLENSMALGTGRFGNGVVAGANTSSQANVGILPISTVIVGFAFKPAGTGFFFNLYQGPYPQVSLTRGASGEIVVYRGLTAGSPLATSATNVLPAAAWSYVEVKTTINNSTGSVVVRVNGVQVVNVTGVDTQEEPSLATADMVRLGQASIGLTAVGNAWDDVYICNTTGTVNNDFLGELTVDHLRPGADDTAQWLGSDGNSTNNYDLVDEAGTAVTTDYVASSTVGQRDLYTPVASTKAATSPVLGVVVCAVAMKTDAGTRTVKLDVKEGSGGTVRQGTEQGLPTTFGELRQVFERKGDGSQFTVADVNALRMGIEVAS
jgi:hypothetical protein